MGGAPHGAIPADLVTHSAMHEGTELGDGAT